MRPQQLAGLDLNLLTLADSLLETRSVTEAARVVHLSQPAVSRALARLRTMLGDDLLVRERRTMVLTPYAQRLRPRLRSVLLQLERVLAEQEQFDPHAATGAITIATQDYASIAFMPAALERLEQVAPSVELVTVPYVEPFELLLESDECDFAVGPRPSRKSWITSACLFTTSWSCVARAGHPWLLEPTLDGFCGERHIMVSPLGQGAGPIDAALAGVGRTRRVVARMPEFAGALALAAQTDLLLSVPDRLASAASRFAPLVASPLPFEMPESRVFLSWHATREDEARARWARSLIGDVVAFSAASGRSGSPDSRGSRTCRS